MGALADLRCPTEYHCAEATESKFSCPWPLFFPSILPRVVNSLSTFQSATTREQLLFHGIGQEELPSYYRGKVVYVFLYFPIAVARFEYFLLLDFFTGSIRQK